MRRVILSSVSCLSVCLYVPHFPTLSHKRHHFRRENFLKQMRVLIFYFLCNFDCCFHFICNFDFCFECLCDFDFCSDFICNFNFCSDYLCNFVFLFSMQFCPNIYIYHPKNDSAKYY